MLAGPPAPLAMAIAVAVGGGLVEGNVQTGESTLARLNDLKGLFTPLIKLLADLGQFGDGFNLFHSAPD
jgi:hypothetical protein